MKKKILVVEDEQSIFNLFHTLLTVKGYDVQIAEDGDQALSSLSEFRPDLILLDIMIPGIDGLEVCKIIKGNHETKHTKIIMLTSSKSEDAMDKARENGADWYIAKPFKISQVIENIRDLLEENPLK